MKKLWLAVLAIVILCGCGPREKFSEVPFIQFISVEKVDDGTGIDNQANLTIHFQDGNGDIGLRASDTTGIFSPDSEYYYNFFINYYEKQNGEWVEVELPTPLHARLPYLSESVPESIEGDITILTFINNYFSPYDTIKLSCQLVDRSLNRSNVIETPEIIVKK
ncbi:MAG: hypothetical protein MJZ39_04465 [Bacteroidales bacterium]|nr:hypothetical protein [Bacteroidales bacterium]